MIVKEKKREDEEKEESIVVVVAALVWVFVSRGRAKEGKQEGGK